jgi:hypothetical protein
MDIVYKKGAINHANALSGRPDLKDSLHKRQLLRDWTNDEAERELHAQFFPWNPGYILTFDFIRKSNTLITRINTCLPGNLCLPIWYVNQVDSCMPMGQDYMCRTSLHCDQE